MTSQVIMIFPRKPTVVTKPFFPVFSSELGDRYVDFAESRTNVDGVCCMTAGHPGISSLTFYGITKGDSGGLDRARIELEQMINDARMFSWKYFHIHPDKWYAVIETHDFYKTCEFSYLFLSLLDEASKRDVQIIGWNFSDITDEVKRYGKKIQNMNEKTNPLVNPRALLVFEIYPRSKRRVIAYEQAPTQYKRLVVPRDDKRIIQHGEI